jgi:hypothetical protein
MHRVAPFALSLLLAACSQGADQPADRAASATQQSPAMSSPVDAPSTPPAEADVPRYVGRWATREDLCEGGAWTFTRSGAALEDGPTCQFDTVNEIPGGFQVTATCEQDGKKRQEAATLRFAESARAMLVENLATLPDTGLVKCGTDPQSTEGESK